MGIEYKLKKVLDKVTCPVVVEGRSDVLVLSEYGVEDPIPLNGRPLYVVAREVSEISDCVVVLTDFDSEGEKIAKKLNTFLDKYDVVPKNSIRRNIKRIVTKKGISQIENIPKP